MRIRRRATLYFGRVCRSKFESNLADVKQEGEIVLLYIGKAEWYAVVFLFLVFIFFLARRLFEVPINNLYILQVVGNVNRLSF